jgi:lysophospholipase L1-like esterase
VLQHELGGGAPKILSIAPPVLGEVSGLMGLFFKGGEEASKRLARAYETVAEACRCQSLAAAQHVRASQVDGVHLDPDGHRALALEVKKVLAAGLSGV